MSKLIAVWGSPGSGKTVLSVKLAISLYNNYGSTILVLSCDDTVPVLPYLFLKRKSEEMYSVGHSLSQTDITQQEVIRSIVVQKGAPDLGYLGYKDGENKYTYPAYGVDKAVALMETLKSLADYVIVDCTSSLENVLSATAISQADTIFRLTTPDLKSMSYFTSQLSLLTDPIYQIDKHIVGLNCMEADCYMPISEAKSHFKDVSFVLPYCREIRQQYIDGTLTDILKSKKFMSKCKTIADTVVLMKG